MPNIEDFGVSVEEYVAGLESGIDVLELRRLESTGIPTPLALEVMAIVEGFKTARRPLKKSSEGCKFCLPRSDSN